MLGWVLAWAAAMQPPAAGAGTPEIVLRWVAPEACPSAAAMRAKLAALAPAGARLRPARVVVVAQGEQFTARVELDHGDGWESRELTASSCDAVADAAALVIAIGPEPAEPASPGPEIPQIVPPTTVAQPPHAVIEHRAPAAVATPVLAPPRASSPSPLRIGIGLDAGITWRVVPTIAPSIAGGIALLGRSWRVELRAIRTTRTRVHWPAPARQFEADLHSLLASVRAAWVGRVGKLELPVHGGIDLGGVRAQPRGGLNQRAEIAMLVALQAGAGIAYAPLPWLAVRAELAGLVALARPSFALGRAPPLTDVTYTTPRLGLRALAGVEFRIDARARRRRR